LTISGSGGLGCAESDRSWLAPTASDPAESESARSKTRRLGSSFHNLDSTVKDRRAPGPASAAHGDCATQGALNSIDWPPYGWPLCRSLRRSGSRACVLSTARGSLLC